MNPSQEQTPAWDVLIVGAGPVGLLLANLLGRRKVRTLVIDKRGGWPEWSRAIGIMPPSLAILAAAGLDAEWIARGVPVVNAVLHDEHGVAGAVDFSGLPCPHKMILSCPQSTTMRLLDQSLRTLPGVDLRPGCELMRLHPLAASMRADWREAGGMRSAEAKWVVGCDGADSTTRQLLGIESHRRRYQPRFVMADYQDHTDWGCAAHLFFNRNGSLESFPLPEGRRRWVAMITDDAAAMEPETFIGGQIARLSGWPAPPPPVSRCFAFHPERLRVARLFSGRAVLAGDAAHVMSPIGGQGMNTGFADAAMLANLLPKLLDGDAPEPLLAAYDHIRRQAAEQAARRAAMGMWLGTRRSRTGSRLRRLLLRRLLLRPPLLARLPPHFAMLTISNRSLEMT